MLKKPPISDSDALRGPNDLIVSKEEDMSNVSKLRACPFCGGKPKLWSIEDGGQYIECEECEATTNIQYSDKDDGLSLLVERWNRRVR